MKTYFAFDRIFLVLINDRIIAGGSDRLITLPLLDSVYKADAVIVYLIVCRLVTFVSG